MCYERLKDILLNAENVVFFGGAGVSTGSGIPDFRSASGLYNSDEDYGESPENILHVSYMNANPQGFYEYYKRNMVYPYAEPNDAHYALAELEKLGKLKAVITQNIDGLHQKAGSKKVYELHGSVGRNYCVRCGKEHTLDYVLESDGVPRCCKCGGMVRPDVVMYGEALPWDVWTAAEEAISECDVLIVGGTSLTVNPAASLVSAYEGEHLVIINLSPTSYDGLAELIIREPVEEVLGAVIGDICD